MEENTAAKQTLKILSLDGGGLRAAFSLGILLKLEEVVGNPLDQSFDMIYGTSTGAILAFGIGYLKLSALQCLQLYRELGEVIFPTNKFKRVKGWFRDLTMGAFWDASVLESEFQRLFTSNTRLSDLGKNRSIPCIACIAAECTRTPGRPQVFSTYSRDGMPFDGTASAYVWQALRASTCAQLILMFVVFQIQNNL